MYVTIRFWLISVVFLWFTYGFSQNTNSNGLPFVQNYPPEVHGGLVQNWGFLQDNNGLLYVANGDGVLEYDGDNWRRLSLPNLNSIRSLAKDKNNRIYFGSVGELGYLEKDSVGQLQITSLKHLVPKEHQNFKDVWDTIVLDDAIVFLTDNVLFIYKDAKFKVLSIEDDIFYKMSLANNVIYVYQKKGGLYRLENNSLAKLAHGEFFGNLLIHAILPYSENSLLVGTAGNGLYLYDGSSPKKFNTVVNEYLTKKRLYTACKLSGGHYALGTYSGGVSIINQNGREIYRFTKESGILGNQIYAMEEDNQNGLWLALQNGISRVELGKPYTYFDEQSGFEGGIRSICRLENDLYVGTTIGLYKMTLGDESGTFHKVPEIGSFTWSLLVYNKSIIAATSEGVYEITRGKIQRIGQYASSNLWFSKIDPSRLFVGFRSGLALLYYENGNWMDYGAIKGITGNTQSIAEMPSGDLWLQDRYRGLVKAEFSPEINQIGYHQSLLTPSLKFYGQDNGLPPGDIRIYIIDGVPYFRTDAKLGEYSVYSFIKSKEMFVPDSLFGNRYGAPSSNAYPIDHQDTLGNVWLRLKSKEKKLRYKYLSKKSTDGSYTATRIWEDRFIEDIGKATFLDQDSIAWLGDDILVRYDLNAPVPPDIKFHAYVRGVKLANDSLIFGGTKPEAAKVLPYQSNTVRFEYAANAFEKEWATQYQIKLDGFDADWSLWNSEKKGDYTNLPEGNYTFKVRAKNLYGTLSEEGNYSFQILAPWYRSWWAYLLYAILSLVIILGITEWRSAQLRSDRDKLEHLVALRTEEVSIQAEKLSELDHLKSKFFANISHEFRTPLTLILGPLKELYHNKFKGDKHEAYGLMLRNSQRLLQLINQLLSLSKIESGKMEVHVREIDLVSFLKPVVASYHSLAKGKKIQFKSEFEERKIPLYFDPEKLEQIVHNLLSNAFKFTGDGGEILLEVRMSQVEKISHVRIRVKDSGKGIPKDQIEQIFERFHQIDSSFSGEREGTGIGLALAQELVALHHGKIKVESILGIGSCFSVYLRTGSAHFSPSQMVSDSSLKPEINEVHHLIDSTSKSPSLKGTPLDPDLYQVLIIEDNKDMRNFIGHILSGDYGIHTAADGKEGWNKAVQDIPDLIVSDVMMPKMDGFELCEKIKTDIRTSHIPVVLLTAKADHEAKIEGLEHGADAYLTKPFDKEELLTRLRKLLELRKTLQHKFSLADSYTISRTAPGATLDEKFLLRINEILEKHIDNEDFGITELCRAYGISRVQLHRKLKALTELSASHYIRRHKLHKATELIKTTDMTISEVAYAVGFKSPTYFTQVFSEVFGFPPSELRHSHNK